MEKSKPSHSSEVAIVDDNVQELARAATARTAGSELEQLRAENLELRRQISQSRRTPQELVTSLMLDKESFQRLLDTAGLFAESGIAGKGTREALAAKILYGLEYELTPMEAIQNIDFIDGQLSMRGRLALKLIQSRTRGTVCELIHDPRNVPNGHEGHATWLMGRTPESAQEFKFGLEDAKRAGLMSKHSYQKWAADMYVWRAFARGARIKFQDVMSGAYIHEEMQHKVKGTAEYRAVQESEELAELVPRLKGLLRTIRDEWRADYPNHPAEKADGVVETVKRRAMHDHTGNADATFEDLDVDACKHMIHAFEKSIEQMRLRRAQREQERAARAQSYAPDDPDDGRRRDSEIDDDNEQ